ncbi:MAG TPA: hypothetical protein VJ020_10970 [Anaerolineales bacterium]|nr:hypothetical protein [Anaerolineales bacterium]
MIILQCRITAGFTEMRRDLRRYGRRGRLGQMDRPQAALRKGPRAQRISSAVDRESRPYDARRRMFTIAACSGESLPRCGQLI